MASWCHGQTCLRPSGNWSCVRCHGQPLAARQQVASRLLVEPGCHGQTCLSVWCYRQRSNARQARKTFEFNRACPWPNSRSASNLFVRAALPFFAVRRENVGVGRKQVCGKSSRVHKTNPPAARQQEGIRSTMTRRTPALGECLVRKRPHPYRGYSKGDHSPEKTSSAGPVM
jgi:hypothetical protein